MNVYLVRARLRFASNVRRIVFIFEPNPENSLCAPSKLRCEEMATAKKKEKKRHTSCAHMFFGVSAACQHPVRKIVRSFRICVFRSWKNNGTW